VRAGTIDVALLGSAPPYRPPDNETPALQVQTLTERSLRVAIPTDHPLARHDTIDVDDLQAQHWITSPGTDTGLGVWPGVAGRPRVVHTTRDWLAKLHLVAAGLGLTTIPAALQPTLPPGVCIKSVRGGPQEHRRILLAHLPGALSESAGRLAQALRAAAVDDDTATL
jgi:DNA-binding transcriptional LysR family regulator